MKATFRLEGLSMNGAWDQSGQLVLVEDLQGELEFGAKVLGIPLKLRGSLIPGMDNRLQVNLKNGKGQPAFFLGMLIKAVTWFNQDLAKTLSVEDDRVYLDPNRILPRGSQFRILIRPGSYDRQEEKVSGLRERINVWIQERGGDLAKDVADIIRTVPDLVMLLIGLAKDPRVPAELKLKPGLAVAYVCSPVDLFPEPLPGPLGFADDALAACIAVAGLMTRISPDIIREHWKGSSEIVDLIIKGQELLSKLIPVEVLKRLNAAFGRDEEDEAAVADTTGES